jgi:hypothetical protein
VEMDSNLHIDARGHVSYRAARPDSLTAAEATLQAKNYVDVVQAYNKRISRAVSEATTADELFEYALRLDANGRKRGFTGDGFNSLQDADKGREKADADLRVVMSLARSDSELSAAQLQKVNTFMARHEGDPYFTQKLATGLGARGTLEFWTRISDRTNYGGDRQEALKDLQRTFSVSLGTASHADSGEAALDKAMERWKHEVIKEGPQRLPAAVSSIYTSDEGPYGFQVMSALMRHGDFDSDFLVEYGKGYDEGGKHVPGLIEFDREASKNGDLRDFWTPDGYSPMLSHEKGGDRGLDPMAGYMQAVGRDPEAGQQLFMEKDWSNPDKQPRPDADLKYLLTEREWPKGFNTGKGEGQGYDELGHALEAAALGRPYDQPELGLHRTAESANVMGQTAYLVSENPGFLEDRPGLEKSLATMGAGYIDDIDRSVAGFGDNRSTESMREKVFGDKSWAEGSIHLSEATAQGFLREVGASEAGYEILSSAQQRYTMHAMTAHSGVGIEVETLFSANAGVQGLLNEARGADIQGALDDIKDEKEREIESEGEWKRLQSVVVWASLQDWSPPPSPGRPPARWRLRLSLWPLMQWVSAWRRPVEML